MGCKIVETYRIVRENFHGHPCYGVYCGSVFKGGFRTLDFALKCIEEQEEGVSNGTNS